MADVDVRAMVEDKIAAAEARIETRIVRLEGKIEAAVASISAEIGGISANASHEHQYNRDSRLMIMSTIVVAFLALAGLAIGLATYGDALFGRGMEVRDVVKAVVQEMQQAPMKKP